MALKDSIDKELNSINEKIKFYRNVLFAVVSGIVWNSYNGNGAKMIYTNIVGIIALIIVNIRIKFLETKEKELIEMLKDIK